MKKIILLMLLLCTLNAPTGACACAELPKRQHKIATEKFTIQVKHDTKKRRKQAIFLRQD